VNPVVQSNGGIRTKGVTDEKQWLGTLYAEQGAPYCARGSRGKDMRREEMKEGMEGKRQKDERAKRYEIGREREKEIRKAPQSDGEEMKEEEEEVATGQSPRARIYITVPALTHGYT